MIDPFEVLFGYHPRISYENNRDPQSKSQLADENAAVLCNLMKKLKTNLIKL